jgi:hypothetical protein
LHSRKRGFNPPHHASLPEYRQGFIESYLAFKAYIKNNIGSVAESGLRLPS